MTIKLREYYYPLLATIQDPSMQISAKEIADNAPDDLTAVRKINALLGYDLFSRVITASNPDNDVAAAITTLNGGTNTSALPADYNSYKEAVDTLHDTTQTLTTTVGTLSNLNTSTKSNIVEAINQVVASIDALSGIDTSVLIGIGTTDITGIVTLAGDTVANTVTATIVAVDDKVGNTNLTGVTPLGASAPTTISGGLASLASAVGTSSLNSVGLRGITSDMPSTIKVAIDNIDAALGNGQLLENSSGSGTISGVIGTISTGLLGSTGKTIASAIGNTAITTTAQSLSGAVNEINNKVGNTSFTGVTPLGASAPTTISGGLAVLASAVGTSSLNSVGLRGNTSVVPSTIKIAIDNIDAALGNGQLLENSSGSGTISGVIGTISTGLLGSTGKTIASAIGNTGLTTNAPSLSGAVNEINNKIGATDITGIVTLAGSAVADTVTATIVAVDNKVGNTSLIGVTPLGASAPTTISGGLTTLASALGNGQLLENSSGSGTISGVIGTISTGLLGSTGKTIASAIGNTGLTTNAPSLSGAVNEINSNNWVNTAKLANSVVITSKLANGAVTTSKQGFATWKVDQDHTWSGRTIILDSPIIGCTNASNLGDSTTYYSVSALAPSSGDHVDFVDLLAISSQCCLHCTNQTGLSNCLNEFFAYS